MAADKTRFESYLSELADDVWAEALARILPHIHPVDREATQIWFAFWPLELAVALESCDTPAQVAKAYRLDGEARLERQIDTSVAFLFGAKYWPEVKRLVLDQARSLSDVGDASLEGHILDLSDRLAARLKVERPLVVGIVAVGVMVLRQAGMSSLQECAERPSLNGDQRSTDQRLKSRKRPGGLQPFLWWKAKKHRVTFDESQPGAHYEALEGQDLSTASGKDPRDFRQLDHRRIEGPVPVQCRSGACGYCWIGILAGRENLSELTEFEKSRLEYFGYARSTAASEKHPLVRLACQSRCYGQVAIVIPPWNGVLQPRVSAAVGGSGRARD